MVLPHSGEKTLIIGTDYGHTDPSAEIDAISLFRARRDVSDRVKEPPQPENVVWVAREGWEHRELCNPI